MPLTVALDTAMPIRLGKRLVSTGTVTFDASYPANGEEYTLAEFGMHVALDALIFVGGLAGYLLSWEKATSKIKVFYHDADATPDGPLLEVADTGSLATLVARFVAIGY